MKETRRQELTACEQIKCNTFLQGFVQTAAKPSLFHQSDGLHRLSTLTSLHGLPW